MPQQTEAQLKAIPNETPSDHFGTPTQETYVEKSLFSVAFLQKVFEAVVDEWSLLTPGHLSFGKESHIWDESLKLCIRGRGTLAAVWLQFKGMTLEGLAEIPCTIFSYEIDECVTQISGGLSGWWQVTEIDGETKLSDFIN
jgi:hypothetical protein